MRENIKMEDLDPNDASKAEDLDLNDASKADMLFEYTPIRNKPNRSNRIFQNRKDNVSRIPVLKYEHKELEKQQVYEEALCQLNMLQNQATKLNQMISEDQGGWHPYSDMYSDDTTIYADEKCGYENDSIDTSLPLEIESKYPEYNLHVLDTTNTNEVAQDGANQINFAEKVIIERDQLADDQTESCITSNEMPEQASSLEQRILGCTDKMEFSSNSYNNGGNSSVDDGYIGDETALQDLPQSQYGDKDNELNQNLCQVNKLKLEQASVIEHVFANSSESVKSRIDQINNAEIGDKAKDVNLKDCRPNRNHEPIKTEEPKPFHEPIKAEETHKSTERGEDLIATDLKEDLTEKLELYYLPAEGDEILNKTDQTERDDENLYKTCRTEMGDEMSNQTNSGEQNEISNNTQDTLDGMRRFTSIPSKMCENIKYLWNEHDREETHGLCAIKIRQDNTPGWFFSSEAIKKGAKSETIQDYSTLSDQNKTEKEKNSQSDGAKYNGEKIFPPEEDRREIVAYNGDFCSDENITEPLVKRANRHFWKTSDMKQTVLRAFSLWKGGDLNQEPRTETKVENLLDDEKNEQHLEESKLQQCYEKLHSLRHQLQRVLGLMVFLTLLFATLAAIGGWVLISEKSIFNINKIPQNTFWDFDYIFVDLMCSVMVC